ncbi:MAG: hypothetical protein P8H39_12330 [Thalassotalea sp.]|nr:hypothetical protein [Thalassotalea sp.]
MFSSTIPIRIINGWLKKHKNQCVAFTEDKDVVIDDVLFFLLIKRYAINAGYAKAQPSNLKRRFIAIIKHVSEPAIFKKALSEIAFRDKEFFSRRKHEK